MKPFGKMIVPSIKNLESLANRAVSKRLSAVRDKFHPYEAALDEDVDIRLSFWWLLLEVDQTCRVQGIWENRLHTSNPIIALSRNRLWAWSDVAVYALERQVSVAPAGEVERLLARCGTGERTFLPAPLKRDGFNTLKYERLVYSALVNKEKLRWTVEMLEAD